MTDTELMNEEHAVGAAVDLATALIERGELSKDDAAPFVSKTVRQLRGLAEDSFAIMEDYMERSQRREERVLEALERLTAQPVNQRHVGGPPANEPSTRFEPPADEPEPSHILSPAQIKASITPDRLICQECGEGFEMLKMHLRKSHDMTREEYLEKYGLPKDYPKMSPNGAARRAKTSGANLVAMRATRAANLDAKNKKKGVDKKDK